MKIICVGRNYVEHARELQNAIPSVPLIFMKPATALLKDGKPFYHPDFSNNIHFELELVLKISKNGKAIREQFASDYYEEIGLGIDFTARDLQDELKSKGHPWELAKAFDNAACIGGFIPKSQLNLKSIQFSLSKNGKIVQSGDSADMIFSFDNLIHFVSQYITLQKGDLIFTGTPAGVGKVEVGDHFVGCIGDVALLDCKIR